MPPKTSAKKRKAPEPNQSAPDSINLAQTGRAKATTVYLKTQTPPSPPAPESSKQAMELVPPDTTTKACKKNNDINMTTLLGSFRRQATIDRIKIRQSEETKPMTPSDAQMQSTRNKLGTLVDAILNTKPFETSLQVAYELCQSMCLYDEAKTLYEGIYAILDLHILQEKNVIMVATDQDEFLITIDTHWTAFCDQLVMIRNVFMELDRRYIIHETPYESLIHLGKHMFKKTIMEQPQVQSKTIQSLLHLIQNDRDGIEVDITRARSVTRMLIDLSLYADVLEPRFMDATISYYTDEATTKLRDLSMPDYIQHAKKRIQQEEEQRIVAYLDQTTKIPLSQSVTNQLIYSKVDVILSQGFDGMMDSNEVVPLGILYHFLRHHDLIAAVRTAFADYIKKSGLELVRDPANDQQMVTTLLQFKTKLDKILEHSFDNSPLFSNALKESFETFINSRKSKPAEMLAKFIDNKLRSRTKKQLEDEEEDIEALLDKVLVIFRYIQGKDTFEAFYKRFLSKRLLLNKLASDDMEKNILSKIKTECGPDFTRNLENMFKDMEISSDLNTLFKESEQYRQQESLPITVNVLAQIVWPTYSTADILLPNKMLLMLDAYQSFYTSRFKGRKLTWRNSMGSCVLKANYPKGRKELSVSVFQAIVLMLFNDKTKSSLGYKYIADQTKLDVDELNRVLQSLSCGKHKLLTKDPQGNTFSETDTFRYNDGFTAPINRLKINSIQQEQSAEESKDIHTKVLVDRQYQLEAAIVRVMKSKKQMTHVALVDELFAQLKFHIEATDIKKRIESLVERDYLARDGTDPSLYHYQS